MTEPVQGVVRTGGVERRKSSQERLRLRYSTTSHYHKDEKDDTDDMVDISEEAKKRADGTYHKNILEHLKEDEQSPVSREK